MQFDYFYPEQADQYAFYRIPRRLFTDNNFKELTAEAKILYGLMLDRVSLSLKNMWIDKSRRVYIIFTLKEVMDTLNCGDKKATRLMGELEKCGLIERDRRGLGKPNLIYVKNFNSGVPPNERLQTRQNDDSGVGNMEIQDSSEQRGTNTNKNYIDMFEALERKKPNHFAVRQYKKFKLAAGVVSLKRLLNQSNLKSWSSKMIKKSLEAYFFTLKNKIVFCKKQFQNMSVFCFVSTEIV